MKQDKTHVIYSPSMGYLDEYLPGRLLAGKADHKWTADKKTCFRMARASAEIRANVVRRVVPDAIAQPFSL